MCGSLYRKILCLHNYFSNQTVPLTKGKQYDRMAVRFEDNFRVKANSLSWDDAISMTSRDWNLTLEDVLAFIFHGELEKSNRFDYQMKFLSVVQINDGVNSGCKHHTLAIRNRKVSQRAIKAGFKCKAKRMLKHKKHKNSYSLLSCICLTSKLDFLYSPHFIIKTALFLLKHISGPSVKSRWVWIS